MCVATDKGVGCVIVTGVYRCSMILKTCAVLRDSLGMCVATDKGVGCVILCLQVLILKTCAVLKH